MVLSRTWQSLPALVVLTPMRNRPQLALGDTATSYFVNTESAVVAPLSKNVGLKVGDVVRYNSEPPIRNNVQLRTLDTFFSSGLTLAF